MRFQSRRLGMRARRILVRPVRGLRTAPFPGQGPRNGQDPRSCPALGHPSHSLSRTHGGRGRTRFSQTRFSCVHRPAPGRSAAAAARLLGASCVIVSDDYPDRRLDLVDNNVCETTDMSQDIPSPTRSRPSSASEKSIAASTTSAPKHGIGSESDDLQPAGALNDVPEATRAGGATASTAPTLWHRQRPNRKAASRSNSAGHGSSHRVCRRGRH